MTTISQYFVFIVAKSILLVLLVFFRDAVKRRNKGVAAWPGPRDQARAGAERLGRDHHTPTWHVFPHVEGGAPQTEGFLSESADLQKMIMNTKWIKYMTTWYTWYSLQNGSGQLIFYERPDMRGPKLSNYSITPTNDPQGLTVSTSTLVLFLLSS